MPEIPTQEVETWVVRRCVCGCIHDRPEAGCPECGSKEHTRLEVIDPEDHQRLLRAEEEKREGAARQRQDRTREIVKDLYPEIDTAPAEFLAHAAALCEREEAGREAAESQLEEVAQELERRAEAHFAMGNAKQGCCYENAARLLRDKGTEQGGGDG